MGWGWDDLLSIPTFGGYSLAKHGGEYLYDKLYKDPADAKKAGLDQLTSGLKDLANQQRDFQLQGMNSALNMYGRANAVNKSLYGNPATLSTAPVAPTNFRTR